MKITTWNVRGLTTPNKRQILKRHLVKLGSDIVMLQETKCSVDKGDKFISYCRDWNGFFQPTVVWAGDLELLWKSATLSVESFKGGNNWISYSMHSKTKQSDFELWNIYGPTQSQEKMNL
ncbi:hypothetical protein SUGI_0400510 [Cryptomeria japonica]|nr:hypothetical protein SUGI_0400510 [Cryptomeria japonica]